MKIIQKISASQSNKYYQTKLILFILMQYTYSILYKQYHLIIYNQNKMSQNYKPTYQTIQNLFKHDEISKKFKESIQQITNLFKLLGNYTSNLQEKVDGLLFKQQLEFFKSYKSHMINIQTLINQLENKLYIQSKKLYEYENEGMMAELIKKTNRLDIEVLQMYRKVEQKDKMIDQQKIKISILQKEEKRLNEKIKKFLCKIEQKDNNNLIFPTESYNNQNFSKQKLIKSTAGSIPQAMVFTPGRKKILEIDHTTVIKRRFQNQILKLQKKNTQLLSTNVRVISNQNQMQDYFMDCIQKVKKDICVRNKLSNCTFQQFKKQDKLKVLIMILQNDEIISMIYEKLFGPISNNKIFQNLKYQDSNIFTNRQKNIKSQANMINKTQGNYLPQIKTRKRLKRKNQSNLSFNSVKFSNSPL